MDIEPSWALGGWFLLSNCMAAAKNTPISAETFTKSFPSLQILTCLFILLLLVNLSHQRNPSTTMPSSSEPFKPSESAVSAGNLHTHQTQNSHHVPSSAADREFRAEAHEVPSGPNPISNR
ncbi:hypothetical protein L6164_000452 [Bauhinia variegata]|uniref:Uncharacterized protein n=1 Tax=Bauhinia variegata TaxID=167791 RepID=A0ACB9Q762_BAUVA|nr:hypothetical protein L6164_000452 [Bauhinia variegata]